MYINTTSQQLIQKSIYEVLNINNEEIDDLLETSYKFQKRSFYFYFR